MEAKAIVRNARIAPRKVQIVLEDLAPPVVLRVVMANAQCLEIIPIQCNLRVVY